MMIDRHINDFNVTIPEKLMKIKHTAATLSGPGEWPDENILDEGQASEHPAATLTCDIFEVIVAKGKTADVLSALETGGLPAVLKTLNSIGIPWSLSQTPGLERDRTVPLISLGRSRGTPPPSSKGKREKGNLNREKERSNS